MFFLPIKVYEFLNGSSVLFNVYGGKTIYPSDQEGIERLAQYIIRVPISQERMLYIPAAESTDGMARVIYEAKDGGASKTFLALDGVAQFISYVDPLLCPRCQGSMRVISFIESPETIKKILVHLDLWETQNHDSLRIRSNGFDFTRFIPKGSLIREQNLLKIVIHEYNKKDGERRKNIIYCLNNIINILKESKYELFDSDVFNRCGDIHA